MERFAQTKEAWLRKYLKLPNGLPSDDTFRRVSTAIEPKAFHACFMIFTKDLLGESFSKPFAIDGKAALNSFNRTSGSPHLHLLSAFACEQGLSLGRLAVDPKSNEITAVPKLLELLDLEGHTVSLDAMGCQKKNRPKTSPCACGLLARSQRQSSPFAQAFGAALRLQSGCAIRQRTRQQLHE